jgi:outer membrane protein assembly factor BamB
MSDVKRALELESERHELAPGLLERVYRHRGRRQLKRRIATGLVALVVTGVGVGGAVVLLRGLGHEPRPAAPAITPSNVRSLRTAWTAVVGRHGARFAPVVADGIVYVSSDKLYAFPASCGASGARCDPLWVAESDSGRVFSQPVVSMGVVYASAGALYAFPARCATNGATCDPVWVARPRSGDAPGYSSPAISGRVIYVNDAGGPLGFPVSCATKGRTCAPIWRGAAPGANFPPAVGDGIVSVNGVGTMYTYPTRCSAQPQPCQPSWTAPVGNPLTSPTVAGGMVFARHGALKAFDSECGTDGAVCKPTWVWTPPFGQNASDVSVRNGVVFVSADRLYALPLECATGGGECHPLWSARVEGNHDFARSLAGPLVADDIAFGAGDRLYAFPLSCGTPECIPLWTGDRLTTGGNLSAPASSANAVYFVSPAGRLVALQVPRSRSSPRT